MKKLGGVALSNFDLEMEKHVIDRRISILEEEGILFFKTGVEVGKNYSVEKLKDFDAVVLCGGATIRRLPIPWRRSKRSCTSYGFFAKK